MSVLDMSNYKKEFKEIEEGQTVRINHVTCEAGEDTRRRLYLTRTLANPQVVIGYCHNCQLGGAFYDSYTPYRKHLNSTDRYPPTTLLTGEHIKTEQVEVPPGLVDKVNEWPVAAKAIVMKASLSNEQCEDYGLAYDPSSDRIYVPRYAKYNMHEYAKCKPEVLGYQLRAIYRGSKYLTVMRDDAIPWTLLCNFDPKKGPPMHYTTTIIVEDLLSGIRVMDALRSREPDTRCAVYVNYGVKVEPTMMYHVALNSGQCLVWLDNDSIHVKEQAESMVRTIKMYSDIPVESVETEKRDPKLYNDQSIVRAIAKEFPNGFD